MTPGQERRLREMRSRVLVRSFDYRQRRHASGRGRPPARARRGVLAPPRLIVCVPAERATRIEGARPTAVRLSADVLGAEALVLVPFPARPSSD